MPGPLWEATRSLHHSCEAHAVGKAMASGNPSPQWYIAWLKALRVIHNVTDESLPKCLHRVDRISQDIDAMDVNVPVPAAALEYTATLNTDKKLAGASYVLTGAHLMGGEIMRRRLEGYPTNHLTWDDRKEALVELNKFRERSDISEEAVACFKALLSIMDEIEVGSCYGSN